MYENSLETATMQRAKTILSIEQKLSSEIWQQYCEHMLKNCSPEVCSLGEEKCLGKRDRKRAKEKLLQNVDEIHNVINERLGTKVGNEKSDMDKLLTSVNRISDSLASMGKQNTNFNEPGCIHLNIILDQGKNSRTSTSEEFSSINRKCNEGPNFREKKPETATSSPTSAILSDEEKSTEAGKANDNIHRQVGAILNLMKEAIKNGKLNFTINGETLTLETTKMGESVQHLLEAESESDQLMPFSDSVDSSTSTQPIHCIVNPACPPVRLQDQFEEEADDPRHSSLDLYTSDEITEHTPVQSPKCFEDQATINFERLKARHEGTSFLSTSSDGNTTCDENGYSSSVVSVSKDAGNALRILSNETPGQKINQSKRFHRRLQPPQALSALGSCQEGSSESDFSSSENKEMKRRKVDGGCSIIVCEDGSSSSSQGTEMTDESCSDEIHVSSVSHYASTDIAVQSYSTSPERESSMQKRNVPMAPRVRWADTASEPGSILFLDIREISASTSDNFSGEALVESDTGTGDIGHFETERNTKQQTDI